MDGLAIFSLVWVVQYMCHSWYRQKKRGSLRDSYISLHESTRNRESECLHMTSVSKSLLECSPSHALAESHEVPGAREDVHGVRLVGEGRLHVEDKLDVIDS